VDTTAKTTVRGDGEVEDLGVFGLVVLSLGLGKEFCGFRGYCESDVDISYLPLLAAPYFLASRMAFSALVSFVEATTFIDWVC
jgi:hypothetical protein